MRKSRSFLGGLGGQITLTLKEKCEVKVNYDLAKIKFDLLMIGVPSAVLILCFTTPFSPYMVLECHDGIHTRMMSQHSKLTSIYGSSITIFIPRNQDKNGSNP